jgi:hypothetical protein
LKPDASPKKALRASNPAALLRNHDLHPIAVTLRCPVGELAQAYALMASPLIWPNLGVSLRSA